jgi:hypothetical protein
LLDKDWRNKIAIAEKLFPFWEDGADI